MTSPQQPPLSETLARYLSRQRAAHEAGLVSGEVGEVVPYEAVPVQPVDPRLAWDGARAVLRCFQPDAAAEVGPVPPDWSALVAGHEPAVALAFCVGNFPQLLRALHTLIHGTDLSGLRPRAGAPVAASALGEWAEQVVNGGPFPRVLMALGALRLRRQFEQAADLAQRVAARVPAGWQTAWANELAALAWHRGQAEEAAALWEAQRGSAPVLFNRGMAALFLNKPAAARPLLSAAVAQRPDDDGWHHLGRLYLALAEMRGA
jgi:hypothetical protein